jgi:hypothetical protein
MKSNRAGICKMSFFWRILEAMAVTTDRNAPARTPERRDLELRLIATSAPMLFAVAIFSAGVIHFVQEPTKTFVDEAFSALALLCVFAVSLLIDYALDMEGLEWNDRKTFLGRGYLFLCIVVGAASAAIPVLYDANRSPGAYRFHGYLILFIAFGIFAFIRMMTKDNKHWLFLMAASLVLGVAALFGRSHLPSWLD